ncbi:MAG: aldehyde dehydrogenase family protein [Spongiibacteraceae bacterium]
MATITKNCTDLFIDGRWHTPQFGVEDVINPATEAAIGSAPLGGPQDCEAAINAARRAFDSGAWSELARSQRVATLRKLFDKLLACREEVLELSVAEMGYTQAQAPFQFHMAMAHFEKYLEVALRDPITPLPMLITPQANGTHLLGSAIKVREPIGVVAAITPYNAGFLLGLVKSVPALAAGNTVVLKPSPYTPLQSLLLARHIAELDLPAGVFNLVTGGNEVGEMLGTDPRVDMVSFTGSDAIGRKVMAQAAPTLKKVHLELGGKSALIVRHDADLEIAMQAALFGFVFQAGQGCSMTTRMLVDNRIRGAFVEQLGDITRKLVVGDPAAATTDMGPLIRDVAVARSERFVEAALQDGATLVCGGQRPAHLQRGFFFEPTVFDNVSNDSMLAQQEVFGPIAAVVGFDSDAEAIALANASNYGLGGGIVSRDAGTAMQMALRVRTGMVMINNGPGDVHPDMPFGGFKQSGLGREWGEDGYYEFTELKSIGFNAG